MLKQMGEGFADIKPICTTYNLMVQVDVQGQQPEEFGEAVRSWVACALEEETEGQGWADMLDNFSEDYEEVVAPSPCVSTDLVEDRPTVGADIDLSKFYNAHLGVPYEPNEDERKLQEIAEHYIEQTDKYDEIVCSGRRYGEACPANSHERVAINKNARLVFQGCLATVEHTTPFHAEDLRREIQRQSRRR
jgi:hypothetical protein